MYSITGLQLPQGDELDYAQYDALPQSEKWKVHRTLPAGEALSLWVRRFARLVDMLVPNLSSGPTGGTLHSRRMNVRQAKRLTDESGPLVAWQPDMIEAVGHIRDEAARARAMRHWRHVAVRSTCERRNADVDSATGCI